MNQNDSENLDNEQIDLVLIGHFAIDTIVLKNPFSESHSLGGGVTYGSLAASCFDPDKKICIVSKVGANFNEKFLKLFANHNIDTSQVLSEGKDTTQYLLEYHNGSRDLSLLSKAANLKIGDIPKNYLQAKAIHLTPIADEFTPEFLKSLANHELTDETIFGIDIQGVIRDFDEEGKICMKKDEKTRKMIFQILEHFGERMYFKASDKEAQAVANEKDLVKATEKLGESGANILTTLGPKGLYFKAPGKEIIKINAYKPKKKMDETGAGDCFMATFLLEMGALSNKQRNFENTIEILKRASASASFLIEEKGPKGFKKKSEILKRIKKNKILK